MAVLRNKWILILTFVLCGRVAMAAQDDPQIFVVVYNDAAIPERIIQSAKETVEKIYQEAGVAIVWKNPNDQISGENRFVVRIVRRSFNLPGEDFGIAFVGDDGRGMQADVFYSGIEELTPRTSANRSQIMGHVMAHELGHLLLGMNSHSGLGIMQAHWGSLQLRQMSIGVFKFDKSQSEMIRARVIAAYSVPEIAAGLHKY